MKKTLILITALLGLASLSFAADSRKSDDAKAAADDYPLTACIVSDEPLGSMGDFVAYTHREPGKPDRVIRFCCEGCIEDFRLEPTKYLKKLDAAAKAKSNSVKDKKSQSKT